MPSRANRRAGTRATTSGARFRAPYDVPTVAAIDDSLARAATAMARGDWSGARDLYAEALAVQEDAAALVLARRLARSGTQFF